MFSLTREGETLTWEVDALVAAAVDLPVKEMPVRELEHLLDEVVWFDAAPEAHRRRFGGQGVLDAVHAERIYGAGLEYPILMASTGEVMDGMHRLAKAWMMGVETIKARRFVGEPEPVCGGEWWCWLLVPPQTEAVATRSGPQRLLPGGRIQRYVAAEF